MEHRRTHKPPAVDRRRPVPELETKRKFDWVVPLIVVAGIALVWGLATGVIQ